MKVDVLADTRMLVRYAIETLRTMDSQLENIMIDNKPAACLEAAKEVKSLLGVELKKEAMRPLTTMVDALVLSLATEVKKAQRLAAANGGEVSDDDDE